MKTITAVSIITGVSPSTIRAWERRYNATSPLRDSNGHRLYDEADILRIRYLATAVERGHLISDVAKISTDSLSRLLSDEQPTGTSRFVIRLNESLMDAVLNCRFSESDDILKTASACLSPVELLRDLVRPTMAMVGDLWVSGEITFSEEKVISEGMIRTLHYLYHQIHRTSTGPLILFATLDGEQHGMGALACAYFATTRGTQSRYLGSGVPAEEIAKLVMRSGAQIVGISIAQGASYDYAGGLMILRSELPSHVEVWLGGSYFDSAELEEIKGCQTIQSITEFTQRLEVFNQP